VKSGRPTSTIDRLIQPLGAHFFMDPNRRFSPPEREAALTALANTRVDTLVVGAGINGAVAAAALAGCGVSVAVVDRGDFAGGVSSHSSNLAWGGIKYLESGEWRLVRKLCRSRNRLMDAYPSTVREIRFFTSIRRGFRMWSVLVWFGALLYWLIGNCRMAAPRYLSARRIREEAPVVAPEGVVGGLEYSDCYLYDNDSRFVFNFVRRAADAGALAVNYLAVEQLDWDEEASQWRATVRDRVTDRALTLSARTIINATGPDTDLLNASVGVATEHRHVLSKGIHLIVDRVTELRKVLTFFASDGRLFFVIPMGPKTCIGTTDTPVEDPSVGVTAADRDFVLANANRLLALPHNLTASDVIAERVGVRPLAVAGDPGGRDWVQLSRKHQIEVDRERRFVSVFGGKLTDCLNVGEELVEVIGDLGVVVPEPNAVWFGEDGARCRAKFMARAEASGLDRLTPASAAEPLSVRFWRRYGRGAFDLLEAITADEREAEHVLTDAEYTRAELRLMARREWIVELSDFLRRRSKISQVVRRETLQTDPGLEELAAILMGPAGQQQVAAFRAEGDPPAE
jgi:alpha-glycerophosphate oxidase/glycerol-3-phosphate dehydrogenase